jgi:hypothetical protein
MKLQRWRIVGGIAGVAVATAMLMYGAAMVSAASSQPAPRPVPSLSAEQLRLLNIAGSVEVTSDVAAANVATVQGISRVSAISVATDATGRSVGEPTRVLRAMAPEFSTGSSVSVWIVLFAGGDRFTDGPPGATQSLPPFHVTGVVIDAQTGRVLRMFMC